MDLYIIRHAWAEEYGDPRWPDDSDRPLTAKGCERFAAMVEILSQRGVEPTLIASSPMVRCRETAQILSGGLSKRPKIIVRDELLPQGDVKNLLQWTAKQAEKNPQIAWIGHAPDVEIMTAVLIGQPSASIRFSKGSVAALRFDGPVEIGNAELRWLATAKLLGV
jgi:phosphohistidine phosphatase